ncbi:MAG TPA: calcium-binding protein [Candidatus Paceibacterota bacterium]|nr:calcium-binding protein [Candidatus Paceibacterota bacterium]
MLPQYLPLSCVVLTVCLFAPGEVPGGRVFAAELAPLKSGAPVDYAPLAFQPETWKAKGQSTMLLPWAGSNVVFLTTLSTYDAQLMAHWVRALDGGWALYADLTGRRPEPLKQLGGKATIAAVPDADYTCGAGCGFIGASGIELAMFYDWNYPALQRDPQAIPHYVFYEMGRNFYTFGDRHSCFTTGFAVFMRYVCMDTLGCHDEDRRTREIIEDAQAQVRRAGLPFLRTFTNADGLSEKEPRLKNAAGELIQPSDQPVTYASAMLRLWREQGANPWLRRFCRFLRECPEAPESTRAGAWQQCWNWYLAASLAAQRDLSTVFVEDWRLPLSEGTRKALAGVDWKQPELTPAMVDRSVKAVSAKIFADP